MCTVAVLANRTGRRGVDSGPSKVIVRDLDGTHKGIGARGVRWMGQ